MTTFKKRSIELEAAYFDGELVGDRDPKTGKVKRLTCPHWFRAVVPELPDNMIASLAPGEIYSKKGEDGLFIVTLGGHLHASPGDWIIQGVKGELYPCKPDVFEKLYEPVA